MKRKAFTKIIAVAIAVIMVFSTVPLAFADTSPSPVVIVPGMGAIDLVYIDANGTTAGSKAFPSFGTGTIADIIKTVATLTFPKDGKIDIPEVYALVKQIAGDLLEPLACNSDGSTKYDVGVIKTWKSDPETGEIIVGSVKSCADQGEQAYINSRDNAEPAVAKAISDKIGAENVFIYKYDWRMNTLNHADELNEYIEAVKAQTGKSKVTLVACSMGASVTSAYFNNYKAAAKSSVERCIFLSAGFKGTTLMGEILSGNIALSKEAAKNYFSSMNLAALGLLLNGSLYDTLDTLLKDYKSRIYSEILLPIFKNMPGMWSVMDMSYKSAAVGFAKPDITEFINSYEAIQKNFDANAKELKNAGVQFAVVAQYGFAGIPLTANANYYSDNLIDTRLSSLGATTAPYGEELSSSGASVSADKRVDASTALFAESTWFIKGLGHMGYSTADKIADTKAKLAKDKENGKEVDAAQEALVAEKEALPLSVDLISQLVTANSLSVGADAKYPQFTAVDEYNRLIPLNTAMETGVAKASNSAAADSAPVEDDNAVAGISAVQTVYDEPSPLQDEAVVAGVSAVQTEDSLVSSPVAEVAVLVSAAFAVLICSAAVYLFKKAKAEE